MRRFALLAFTLGLAFFASAQTDTTAPPPPPSVSPRLPLRTRTNDHFLLQLGYLNWTQKPDSIRTKGLPRSFNIYLMLDFPFKTNRHFSVALGPGVSTDAMYFDKTYVGIKDNTPSVRFQNVSDTNNFKKYKLATAFLEAPIELRYRFNPNDDRRSVKLALGAKVGTLLAASVKGKELRNRGGTTILDYTDKEKNKKFFNKTRLSVMARAGYGHFTLFASYSVTPLFRENLGPEIRPLTVGLTLSGL